VAATETSLVVVLTRMLRVADTWEGFAEQYVRALGKLCDRGASMRRLRGSGDFAQERASALAEWHGLLLKNLMHTKLFEQDLQGTAHAS
jgi:hypothetical protein